MRRLVLLGLLLSLAACAGSPTEPDYKVGGLTCTIHQMPDGTITDYNYCR